MALTLGLLIVVLMAFSASSHAQKPELTLQSLLAVGKGTGACGILHQQLTFQSTTMMAGGNEFIVRFWTTEAARLGMTLDQYAEHCTTAIASYDKLWELSQ